MNRSQLNVEGATFFVSVDQVDEADWERLLPQFADANLYQTWAYGAVRWGPSKLSHLLLYQGDQVVAMAQLRIARLPLLPAGIAYLRWGPLWQRRDTTPDPRIAQTIVAALKREYVQRRGLTLQIIANAFEGTAAGDTLSAAMSGAGLRPDTTRTPYRTFLVDLRPPIDAIRKALNQKWRNQLNGSERNGLQLEISDGPDAYRTFLSLYGDMWARKQFDTTVDVQEFGRIQDALSPTSKMSILTASASGSPVGSVICSSIGETALYVLGATNEQARDLKASYFVHWQTIQLIKSRGAKFYDLGGANPDTNPGGYHFKGGFGGTEISHISSYIAHGTVLSRGVLHLAERRRRQSTQKAPATPTLQ
jgi:hypothetical protein